VCGSSRDSEYTMLSQFNISDDRIVKLNKIINKNPLIVLNSINSNAAWWENCEHSSDFPNWASKSNYNWMGYQANWVGRVATDQSERTGNAPCDFSFYLENPRINYVQGWSVAMICAISRTGGVSIKRYGYNNMKAILGWNTLTGCLNSTFNTELLRNSLRFY
jgi:hypothetical protein